MEEINKEEIKSPVVLNIVERHLKSLPDGKKGLDIATALLELDSRFVSVNKRLELCEKALEFIADWFKEREEKGITELEKPKVIWDPNAKM